MAPVTPNSSLGLKRFSATTTNWLQAHTATIATVASLAVLAVLAAALRHRMRTAPPHTQAPSADPVPAAHTDLTPAAAASRTQPRPDDSLPTDL